MPWLTPQEVAGPGYWPGCPLDPTDETEAAALQNLLDAAADQCRTFANVLPAFTPIPERWRQAQGLQARALYRSSTAAAGDTLGEDGFTVTVYPMDWNVKALLRPPAGVPVIA